MLGGVSCIRLFQVSSYSGIIILRLVSLSLSVNSAACSILDVNALPKLLSEAIVRSFCKKLLGYINMQSLLKRRPQLKHFSNF